MSANHFTTMSSKTILTSVAHDILLLNPYSSAMPEVKCIKNQDYDEHPNYTGLQQVSGGVT
jgi:hypothetical protein